MDFIAEKNDTEAAVSSFLREKHGFSRRLISSLKFENRILVNGEPVWTNFRLRENDVVTVIFSDKKSEWVQPENIPLDILYEDEHILAVNKPPDMPPHPSAGHSAGTLANAVLGYYNANGINTAVRILGRLDKDTSGAVILCKNRLTHKLLAETKIKKYYIAVCKGVLPETKGIINEPIMRVNKEMKRVVSADGKPSVTIYNTLSVKNGCSLVRLELVTGRTHQLRVHLSHMGCPIAGDVLYGSTVKAARHLLHAEIIAFQHPFTKNMLSVTAPIPEDFKQFWNTL